MDKDKAPNCLLIRYFLDVFLDKSASKLDFQKIYAVSTATLFFSLFETKGSKDFVSKLVADKIQEFVEHFSYLFSSEIKTPIKINLINTGDCKEIVQGIVKYYVHELNTSKTKRVIPIQVIMYAESKMDNAFEIMSQIDDAETLIKALTSSGYDAITVTKKSKQYQNTISRYLEKNGVENVQIHSKKIINMFNALNGDWLLRMLSYKSHFPVEKLSILSAMKLSVKRYSLEDIIWVPISLEEILRVSGSVGLSQSGSIFSARNLGFDGKTSDDLLLVGSGLGTRSSKIKKRTMCCSGG